VHTATFTLLTVRLLSAVSRVRHRISIASRLVTPVEQVQYSTDNDEGCYEYENYGHDTDVI